jgi:HNH endonuclease
MKCALCDISIVESNDSKEHLIPNAVGGKKKLRGVLCVTCNGDTGKNWDSELAAQLNPLSVLFNIRRDRGPVPPHVLETASGKAMRLHPDGSMSHHRPSYEEEHLSEKEVRITIAARTLQEAHEMLKGVKRKYPKADLNALKKSAAAATSYLSEHIKLSFPFGGPLAGRSVVKSCLCLAVASGVHSGHCSDARKYLLNENADACYEHFYERDLVMNRPSRQPFHLVAVSTRGTDGQLLAYVEYFGVRRLLVRLARKYVGPEVHCSYALDPVSGQELALEFSLALSEADVDATLAYERVPDGSMEEAFNGILPTAMHGIATRERERAIAEAINFAANGCGVGPDDPLTEAQAEAIPHLIMQSLQPYLARQVEENIKRRRAALPGPPDDDSMNL